MKKLLFIVLSIVVLYPWTDCDAQLKFGAKAGITIAGQTYKNFSDDFRPGKLPGIMIGGVAEYSLTDNIHLASGLQLETNGYKYSEEGYSYKLAINYLKIPVQAQYHYDQFYGALGFYAGFALGAKWVDDDGDTEKAALGKKFSDDFSASDFGINIEAGYQVNENLRGTLSLGFGLANIIPGEVKEVFDESIKNNVIGLHVTWFFHECRL